jgi:hypothetical protein
MKQHHFYTVCKSSEISCAVVYSPDFFACLDLFLKWYTNSTMSFLGFSYVFGAGKSLLATSLLFSPNYDFWRMSGFEPRVLLQQAGVLLTEPPIHKVEWQVKVLIKHLAIFFLLSSFCRYHFKIRLLETSPQKQKEQRQKQLDISFSDVFIVPVLF